MLWMLAACNPEPTFVPTAAGPPTEEVQRTVFTTRDDVDLVGDVYAGTAGAPAVVLLHMTPVGGATRVDWPVSFIEQLTAEGYWVVALDRRGAGESEGVAVEAFEGDAGRYDAEAVTTWLATAGAGDFAILGASNGTTTALDYAVWAASEGLPEPVALGFLTGGSYTENQTSMDELGIASVFTYSTAERAWSVDQMDGAPTSWEFLEYADGAHGTRMFDAEPTVGAALAEFLTGVL